jgi:hypothetical protein
MTRATAAGNATAKPRVYRHRALSRLDSGETTRALRRNLNSGWSPLVPADQRIAVSSRPQIAALLLGGKTNSRRRTARGLGTNAPQPRRLHQRHVVNVRAQQHGDVDRDGPEIKTV